MANADPFLPRGLDRSHDPCHGPNMVRASGSRIWDENGRDYIDLVSSYASNNFGYSNPRLLAAAKEQLSTLTHLCGHTHPWKQDLTKALAALAPFREPCKVWLTVTGARAVELAWKISFADRPGELLTFDQGFHGRSMATGPISATASLPVLGHSYNPKLTYPECSRCPVGKRPTDCQAQCLQQLETTLDEFAKPCSAVLVEPAAGARGYLFPPDIFFQRLRSIADDRGFLLISDEIQMGLGRLGGVWACQSQGWIPDLIVLGKSLGGGIVPISCVVGPSRLMDVLDPGIESETFAGNPLSARIALEVIQMLTESDVIAQGHALGETLRIRLLRLRDQNAYPYQVEGRGASAVLVWSDSGDRSNQELAMQFAKTALDHGVLIHHTGRFQNRSVMIPALTMSHEELNDALERLSRALSICCSPRVPVNS